MVQYVALPSQTSMTALRIVSEDGWLTVGLPCILEARYFLSKNVEPGWSFSSISWNDRGVELLRRLGITLVGVKIKEG
jgi:hypothetical protein